MVSRVYRIVDALAGRLLPPRCVLCHGPGRAPSLDLCADCARDLPRHEPACLRCGLPVRPGAPVDSCALCAGVDLPYSRCLAAFAYAFPVDRLVQSLKYEGALAHARVLGQLVAECVRRSAPESRAEALVPMPLHRQRLVERGFDQALEIARVASASLGLGLEPMLLERRRPTAPQVGLSRVQRLQNVEGAFCARRSDVAGASLALLDDVVTTGATVAAAASALRDAGAREVEVWCVARARP